MVDFVASFAGAVFRYVGDRLSVKFLQMMRDDRNGEDGGDSGFDFSIFLVSCTTKAAVEVFLNGKFRPWHIWFAQGVMDAGGRWESVVGIP